jgi:hypothetical protein
MKAGPNLDSQRLQSVAQDERAADGSRGAIEARKQTVSGEVRDHTAELNNLSLGYGVVGFEQLTPTLVAELGGAARRVDDVGEQDGGEHPIAAQTMTDPRQELLNLVDHDVNIANGKAVVVARHFDEPGVWDPVGNITAAVC